MLGQRVGAAPTFTLVAACLAFFLSGCRYVLVQDTLEQTAQPPATEVGVTEQIADASNEAILEGTRTPQITIPRYVDDAFGISFHYPADWRVEEAIYPDENYRGLDLIHETLGLITVAREDNARGLTPRQWYEENKHKYRDELVREVAETEVGEDPVLLLGQPAMCQIAPMMMAIVSHEDELFIITQFEMGERPTAVELRLLLETLSFDEQERAGATFPDAHFQYPQAPSDADCP